MSPTEPSVAQPTEVEEGPSLGERLLTIIGFSFIVLSGGCFASALGIFG